jgi:hypothetical protein
MFIKFNTFNDYLKKYNINFKFEIETPSSLDEEFEYDKNLGFLISDNMSYTIEFKEYERFGIVLFLNSPNFYKKEVIAFGLSWRQLDSYLISTNYKYINEDYIYEKKKEILENTKDIQKHFINWIFTKIN